MPKVVAVVVAGGKGTRFGSELAKQYLSIIDKPIIAETLSVIESTDLITEIVLVVPKNEVEKNKKEIVDKYNFNKVKYIVEAGHKRQNSVYNGLKAILSETDYVLIHDGVRPLLSKYILENVIKAAWEYGAASLGLPVKETIKIINNNNFVEKTIPREKLWSIQTPQVFKWKILWNALQKAMAYGVSCTDEAGIVEWYGNNVKIVKGDYNNIKITTFEDLLLARLIMERYNEDRNRI